MEEYLALSRVDYDEVLALRQDGYESCIGGIKFNIDEIRPQLKTEPNTAFLGSGRTDGVVGAELRPGNIWENVELPRLIKNPNVTKITIIDSKTGIEIVIFER